MPDIRVGRFTVVVLDSPQRATRNSSSHFPIPRLGRLEIGSFAVSFKVDTCTAARRFGRNFSPERYRLSVELKV